MAKSTPALTLSDFEDAEQDPGSRCWFQVKLTPEQQKAVTEARDAGRSHDAISRVLKSKLAVRVNPAAVRHHFAGECRCARR